MCLGATTASSITLSGVNQSQEAILHAFNLMSIAIPETLLEKSHKRERWLPQLPRLVLPPGDILTGPCTYLWHLSWPSGHGSCSPGPLTSPLLSQGELFTETLGVIRKGALLHTDTGCAPKLNTCLPQGTVGTDGCLVPFPDPQGPAAHLLPACLSPSSTPRAPFLASITTSPSPVT